MTATHDIHRVMEDNFFGAFQRDLSLSSSSSFIGNSKNHRSLTASDLVNLPPSLNYPYQRRHIATSVTSPSNPNGNMPLQYKCRPSSDILQSSPKKNISPEAEAIDQWFENIQRYEQMLEEVAAASLDQSFKDELCHINQWLRNRSDAERTATLYSIVQNASQIQVRFLITVLQKLVINDDNSSVVAGQQLEDKQQQQQQHSYQYYNNIFSNKSMLSPSKSTTTRNRLPLSSSKSAISEPDDLRRRNRDLFVSRPLGLSHPGPLYEKALQARAQLQAMNLGNRSGSSNSSITSSTNSTLSTSSTASSVSAKETGGLFSSPPRLRANSTSTLFNNQDWLKQDDKKSWSFGSLNNTKKDDLLPWAIQEEELGTLEQAQARLRQDDRIISPPTLRTSASVTTSTNTTTAHSTATMKAPMTYTSPKRMEEESDDEGDSDASSNKEKPLTGLARRRKRSSAARALKDKLAAETVDFELMEDVQNWLRSLRLHKYGHAFIGLNWKQVVRMSDQDMIVAGVNTTGARTKLLKVFQNVQHHCTENGIEY